MPQRFGHIPQTAALLACLLWSTGAAALEPVTLQLKWTHQFQFAGYYAALEKGFYADAGLDVTIRERTPGSNHLETVLDGAADYGISDSSLILHRLLGRPVVALAAVYQHSPLVLVTRAADGLFGPHELKGRRVMRQSGTDDAVLTAMFHQAGIDPHEIIDIPHTLDDDALIRGDVDAISAYITNQPFYFASKGLDIHVINPLNYGVDFYGDILFTTEQEMRRHPDRALRFRAASLRGWEYALAHKDEVIGWIRERYGVDRSVERLRHEADSVEQMIAAKLVEIGHLNTGRFNWIADIYRGEDMAPNDSSLYGIDYRDFLPNAGEIARWLWPVAIGAVLALLALLSISIVNRRLARRIALGTAQLREAGETLQQYVDIVDKYVITSNTDAHGVITYASDAFCRVSKYSRDELLGKTHGIVRHPDMPETIYNDLWKTITQGRSWHGELKNRAKDGSAYWVDVNIDPQFDEDGGICGYTAIRQEISDRKRIEELSITDKLTGLFNRHKIEEAIEHEIERHRRYGNPLALALFDADHFKQINDAHGHHAGDAVLEEIATVAKAQVRATDIVGRWGGEEFLIICPETALQGAVTVAEKVRQAIAGHRFTHGGRVTASFGVAEIGGKDDIDTLIQRADQAMYRAKREGRNRSMIAETAKIETRAAPTEASSASIVPHRRPA